MNFRKILLIGALIYSGIFAYMLSRTLNLEFDGELIALLPSDNNHLATYKKLTDLNSSEGGFDAIIKSTDGKPVIDKAQKLVKEFLSFELNGERLLKGVELENDLHDIKYSALFLMTESELQNTYTEVFKYIEAKKEQLSPFYVDLSDGSASNKEFSLSAESSVLLNEISESKRYRINEDSTAIRVTFIANFAKSDFSKLESAYIQIQDKTEELESEFIGIEMFWGGSYIKHFNKINTIRDSVLKALIIGTFSLIFFLMGYMFYINRAKDYKLIYVVADLLIIFFILFSGFIISLGIASFLLDEIYIFTGIIFSGLFGINLDYILHVYSINKKVGLEITSIRKIMASYISSARPIVLSALTTGLAAMSLIFADFDGLRQVGLIFFINIVVNLVATYLFLFFSKSVESEKAVLDSDSSSTNIFSNLFSPQLKKKRVLFFTLLLVGISFGSYVGYQKLSFNYSFSELEPKSVQSEFDQNAANVSSGKRYNDPSFYITDTIEDSKKLYKFIKEGLKDSLADIEKVESFSARYPVSKEERNLKTQKIDSLKELVDRNRQFLNFDSGNIADFVQILDNTIEPDFENLPDFIKNRFFYRDNSMAPLVVVYPKMNLSNGERSIKFRKSSGSILMDNTKYYAASTYIIASSILELLIKESTFLFLTPLLTIFVFLLIYYRSFVYTLIAIMPLVLTFALLLSLKALFVFDINLYNVLVFPIIIGVGADTGVHLVDSLKMRRKTFLSSFISQKFPVLSACSITTILGFIGLIFINHPGMESVGVLAITGVLSTLFATLISSVMVDAFLSIKKDPSY